MKSTSVGVMLAAWGVSREMSKFKSRKFYEVGSLMSGLTLCVDAR
jgi:hypothetical protein